MEEDEADEVVDDAELVRCALLRCINIRVTSALMESIPSPLLFEFHRGSGCKLGGDATAVIGVVFWGYSLSSIILPLDVPNPLPCEPLTSDPTLLNQAPLQASDVRKSDSDQ